MIRKPAGDWNGGATALTETLERTAAVARQGKQVAELGVRAAGTGLYSFQGLVCWGFALLWGGLALVTLLFGQVPLAIGIGVMALVAALGGKRAFGRAKRTAGYEAMPVAAPRAGACEVNYSRSALLVALFTGLGLAAMALSLFAHTRGFTTLLLGIAAIAGPVLSVLCAIRLAGDPLALRWDARGITVATLTKRRTLAWKEVSDVTLSRLTTYVWGVVPIGRTTTLALKLHRGRSIGLTPGFLALDGSSADDLAEKLDRCRRGHAHAPVELPATDGFDPDAIMARYLAEKQAPDVPASPSMPPPRTFGRKVA